MLTWAIYLHITQVSGHSTLIVAIVTMTPASKLCNLHIIEFHISIVFKEMFEWHEVTNFKNIVQETLKDF